jgi:hypothetical protein
MRLVFKVYQLIRDEIEEMQECEDEERRRCRREEDETTKMVLMKGSAQLPRNRNGI